MASRQQAPDILHSALRLADEPGAAEELRTMIDIVRREAPAVRPGA